MNIREYYSSLVSKYASEYAAKEAGALSKLLAPNSRAAMNRIASMLGKGSKVLALDANNAIKSVQNALGSAQKEVRRANMRWFGPNNQGKVLRGADALENAASNASKKAVATYDDVRRAIEDAAQNGVSKANELRDRAKSAYNAFKRDPYIKLK